MDRLLKIRANEDTSEPGRGSGSHFKLFAILGGVVVVLLIAVAAILGSWSTIDGSEAGVYVMQGNPVGQRGPGFQWKVPFVSDIATITVRRQQIEAVGLDKAKNESAAEAEARSGAEHVELASDAKARGGQIIDQAPFRLWYHVPPALFKIDDKCQTVLDDTGSPIIERQDNLVWLYNTIGKNDDLIRSSAVMGPARNVVKDVLLQFEPAQLIGFVDPTDPDGDKIMQFGDINGEFNQRVFDKLCVELHSQGVVLEDFSIGKLDFNDRYETKVADTQEAAQQVEVERFKVQAAEQVAQAAMKEGEGEANKNKAIADGNAYKTRQEADAANYRVKLEADANAYKTAKEAEADAHATEINGTAAAKVHALDVEAVGGTDAYVQIQIAEEVGQWRPTNLIGGGDNGVIPILDLAGDHPTQVVPVQAPDEEAAK